jgi:riboflavin synthase
VFTGIVEEVGKVLSSQPDGLTIAADKITGKLELGASVSVNGVCLTVTGFGRGSFSVDVMPETLSRSNLGILSAGDEVNLEKSMSLGGSLGGHLVQGHVDDTGRLSSIRQEGGAVIIKVEAPPEVMHYIVEKGFIAVDGISLTVTSRDNSSFQVSVVNFTRQNTILRNRKVGDRVNLEIDIIAKYVEQFICPPAPEANSERITAEFLQANGFPVN